MISNVVTKSGGNRFSGFLNYFFQSDNPAAKTDKRLLPASTRSQEIERLV
ncbi:MAG: hypothetical protein GTN89_06060 [Acidobacteria bacterium]|nr:hypothetical protein [Acidobacteriota bacterium]NIM62490.1 hypothetical protein [Acidobacteriota bacterium]NIO58877.1 hypothetical protein [Acidobacteriota bacterium]NIQ29929.1 hypothetical protein [Acidobacteriota bacterium]NIQ84673.1 hypothetical protein [Acidobacteriota bacterium]